MCGIAGLFYPATPKPVDPQRIAMMIEVQAHRGPDGRAVWTAPGEGIGHRRLSIIDLGGGAQPMQSFDERIPVTYNGEIYHFRAVRPKLEPLAARLRTHLPTEGLPHGRSAHGHVGAR